VEWKHDQYVSFKRNEDYWGIKPLMKNLELRIISNQFTAIAEFETGNVAIIEPLPEAEVLRWKTHPQWKDYTRLEQDLVLDQILFNTEKEPFTHVEVRRALSQTLEVPLLLEAVREGAGILANGPIPKGITGNSPNIKPYPYQPDKALDVLKQYDVTGREFTFLIPSSDPSLRLLGEIIQEEWKRLGIKVRLQQMEWVTFKRMMLDGEFDLCFQNWYGDYPDGDNFLYPLFHSSQIGLVNGSRLNDPEVDRLIEESQSEQDTKKRIQLLEQANALIVDKAPAMFMWYRAKYVVVQPWLKDYQVPLIFNGTRVLQEKIQIPQ
jgi:ABC-type transport system substrate-binding protein